MVTLDGSTTDSYFGELLFSFLSAMEVGKGAAGAYSRDKLPKMAL